MTIKPDQTIADQVEALARKHGDEKCLQTLVPVLRAVEHFSEAQRQTLSGGGCKEYRATLCGIFKTYGVPKPAREHITTSLRYGFTVQAQNMASVIWMTWRMKQAGDAYAAGLLRILFPYLSRQEKTDSPTANRSRDL